ncbi:MAG: hypothetical protein AB7G39_14810 [Alphaproteobacteria bacterium]
MLKEQQSFVALPFHGARGFRLGKGCRIRHVPGIRSGTPKHQRHTEPGHGHRGDRSKDQDDWEAFDTLVVSQVLPDPPAVAETGMTFRVGFCQGPRVSPWRSRPGSAALSRLLPSMIDLLGASAMRSDYPINNSARKLPC